jgi:hypothetical protein
MAGSAVAITVPSRHSMKKAPATSSGSVRGWARSGMEGIRVAVEIARRRPGRERRAEARRRAGLARAAVLGQSMGPKARRDDITP